MQSDKFSSQVVENIEKLSELNNYDQSNLDKYYDKIAGVYENAMTNMGHPDPHHCGDAAKELIESAGKTVNDSVCLDMGCGTGLVGVELHKRGFTEITGVDASQEMLSNAKDKSVYKDLQHLFLGKPETFPEELHNKFDIITAAAILAQGHLENPVFDEMLLALKTGGFVIFTTREEYLTKYNYIDAIKAHEESGKWKKVKEHKF